MAQPTIARGADIPWETWRDPALAERSPVRWRDLLGREPGASHSIALGVAEIPPGAALARHRHAAPEVYYLIAGAGRVEVDGQVVRRFGARVDPETQVIRVDGKRIPARQDVVYLAFNKPRGVLTAMSDDRGRKTIVDFLGDRAERLFHVGRLDYDTEGLMLLTNDGELAHRLAHPSYEVSKTYWAEVPGPIPRDLGRRLQAGVELEDGVATADKFRVLEQAGARAMVEITLHEGRKHIVRRMLAEVGHPVSRLLRTTVGPIKLGSLRPGATRDLTTREIGELYAAVGL